MVYRQTKNQITLKSLQKDLQFHMIDDLLNSYVALEKIYINHALESGFQKDKQTFISTVHKETEIARKLAEGQIDSKQAQREQEEGLEDEDLNHDLVDDFCLILDKSTKRVSWSSIGFL